MGLVGSVDDGEGCCDHSQADEELLHVHLSFM